MLIDVFADVIFFSRGYLQDKYNWGYHYYFLADEGVEYLRDYLHLDASAFPDTHIARPGKSNEDEAERPAARSNKWRGSADKE